MTWKVAAIDHHPVCAWGDKALLNRAGGEY
jgi:hypothetical protein